MHTQTIINRGMHIRKIFQKHCNVINFVWSNNYFKYFFRLFWAFKWKTIALKFQRLRNECSSKVDLLCICSNIQNLKFIFIKLILAVWWCRFRSFKESKLKMKNHSERRHITMKFSSVCFCAVIVISVTSGAYSNPNPNHHNFGKSLFFATMIIS